MKGSLYLGRYVGIRLMVHWSFVLILVWVGWMGWQEGGWASCLWAQALILLLFLCVVLHEFGHSVVAMRFGVTVRSIVLLPIGGVASMSDIPRRPVQELLIALAGPFVNVVIVLFIGLLTGRWMPAETADIFPTNWPNLVDKLLLINIVLVLFNMLPAFPMDGGRVLRSLLAMFLSYGRATRIAASVGQGMAVLFFLLALYVQNPFLLIIAVFVFLGASSENHMVRVQDRMKGIRAQDMMHGVGMVLSPSDPLERCQTAFEERQQKDFLVMHEEKLVGLVEDKLWQKAVQDLGASSPVSCILRKQFICLSSDSDMAGAWPDVLRMDQTLFPVMEQDRVLGIVSLEDVRRSLALTRMQERALRPHGVAPRSIRTIDLG